MKNLTFPQAMILVLAGINVQREGWNGNGMHIAKYTGDSEAFPQKEGEEIAEDAVAIPVNWPILAIMTPNGSIQPGWVPSTADMFAEDWCLLDEEESQEADFLLHGKQHEKLYEALRQEKLRNIQLELAAEEGPHIVILGVDTGEGLSRSVIQIIHDNDIQNLLFPEYVPPTVDQLEGAEKEILVMQENDGMISDMIESLYRGAEESGLRIIGKIDVRYVADDEEKEYDIEVSAEAEPIRKVPEFFPFSLLMNSNRKILVGGVIDENEEAEESDEEQPPKCDSYPNCLCGELEEYGLMNVDDEPFDGPLAFPHFLFLPFEGLFTEDEENNTQS